MTTREATRARARLGPISIPCSACRLDCTIPRSVALVDDRDDAPPGVPDPDDRHCPSCGTLMRPVGLPSGEIVARCPECRQIAI
jgi:hypothetical protein